MLDALAGGDRAVLDALIARGRVVMLGNKRGAVYALTGWRDAASTSAR